MADNDNTGTEHRKPTVIITIGMAGSGKTTFVQRINAHLHAQQKPPYILNLDPAVTQLPFDANIDIRDTVDYAQVMKQSVFLLATSCISFSIALQDTNLGLTAAF